jgi:hypothetical protein
MNFCWRGRIPCTTSIICPVVSPLRDKFGYNNWGYAVVAEVVEPVAEMTFGEFLRTRGIRGYFKDDTFRVVGAEGCSGKVCSLHLLW